MSEIADRLIEAAQKEARTRPRLRGNNDQGLRKVELGKELDSSILREARVLLDAGKISLEEFYRRTARK